MASLCPQPAYGSPFFLILLSVTFPPGSGACGQEGVTLCLPFAIWLHELHLPITLSILQVTQLQYLNAFLATQAQNLPQTPEDTGLQVV